MLKRPMGVSEIRDSMKATNVLCRPIWRGDDGFVRCGKSGDVVTMMEDLNSPTFGGRIDK